jgi:hypothetical protein
METSLARKIPWNNILSNGEDLVLSEDKNRLKIGY